jgi:hypothetical protein
MRKIRDVLRLKFQTDLSHERIAASLGISKGVVVKYVSLAGVAGLNWPLVQTLSDTALERRVIQGRQLGLNTTCRPTMGDSPGVAPQGHDAGAAVGGIRGRLTRPYPARSR